MTEELGSHTRYGDRSNTALLVIDVQQGLFERSTPIYKADQVLENIHMLVCSARPGRIKKEIRIDLPRPRRLGNLELIKVSNLIMQELRSEMETVLKEELHDG